MNRLYLKLIDPSTNSLSIESLIPLFIYRHLKLSSKLSVHLIEKPSDGKGVSIQKINENNSETTEEDSWITTCELPNLYKSDQKIGFSGICCVARQLVKLSDNTELLGYKGTSLNATSEASVWVKFCEIDMIKCISSLINDERVPSSIPTTLLTFEMHLSTPTKVHNYYKLAREIALEKELYSQKTMPGIEKLNIVEHKFAEGYTLSVADLILFVYYSIVFQLLSEESLENHIPLTMSWYSNLKPLLHDTLSELLDPNCFQPKDISRCTIPMLPKDVWRKHNVVCKNFTKQENVDKPLEILYKLNLDFVSKTDSTINFDWSKLPLEVLPENGLLPAKRVERKKQQLENIADAVVRIAKPNDVIVDFCCGTGHLGLVLACALPQCHIILLDNKEESLTIRGKAWVDQLKLTNVSIFQGNINYFNRDFDIGVSLHACGVATDIVLQKCMNKMANFVCVPCCYGAIYDTQSIKYPRSRKLRDAHIDPVDYIYLAHAADQAHDRNLKGCNIEKADQGELCMDIVDTDRKLAAEDVGYKVVLKRLYPESCTPKNRLLIGIYE